jgi:predicted PurR-regulated permease PerM
MLDPEPSVPSLRRRWCVAPSKTGIDRALSATLSTTSPTPAPATTTRSRLRSNLRWGVFALCVLALWALVPLWAPIVLAIWTALLVYPLYLKLSRHMPGRKNGRSRAAGAITVLMVLALVLPLLALGISLVAAASDLAAALRDSKGGGDTWRAALSSEPTLSFDNFDSKKMIDFARQHGGGAMRALQTTFDVLATATIGLVVYVVAFHAALLDGPRGYAWFLERSPIPRADMERFATAFAETGRGLFVGVGLTALMQGTVATIGYVALGLPQALVLGLVTTLAALIPSVGTGLVWVPVSVVLFAADRTVAGAVLVAIGCFTSIIDNFARPWLSRYGHLDLPMVVVFMAMLGGIAAFGGFGLLLGPLFVRLAVEGLEIWRKRRAPA